MNKVLDLSVFNEQTFDIKMLDGSILNVAKPTQAMVIEMVAISQDNDKKSQEEMLSIFNKMCSKILNHNKNNKSFTEDWVADNLDFGMITAIIQGYADFTTELQANPI